MSQHSELDAELLQLASQLGAQLAQSKQVLTLAESCTGGLAASYVTQIAGSSAWFDRGFVTYSNQAKLELLGVSHLTLEQYGAVSEAVAKEMASGARQHAHAHIAASITGIAGPTGGSELKPVGTVCFAWVNQHSNLTSRTLHFTGDRQLIRLQAVRAALLGLIQISAQN
jgi:nicotinamide-nucleotide amidase